jgi:3(or 17)beta-hydroxysteroid dehydrogenase
MPAMADLKGKIVLITGAAGAVGGAVAAAVKVAGGTAVASDLKAGGGIELALDVTDEAGWRRAVAEIERGPGRLDGLVNAAGIVALGSVEQLDYADWRRVLAVNLDGTFLGCKYAFPLLRRQGGAIVNLSSVSGLVGGHNLAAYNASKGGVSLLSKSVALAGARCQPAIRRRPCRKWRPRSRCNVSASRPKSPRSASICCRTMRASSPAPICRSTAA